MKKVDFISLLLGLAGGMFFALGMCMCLVTEWGRFDEGVIMGAVGLAVLLIMIFIRRRMLGKPPIRLSGKNLAALGLGLAGVLCLGIGMCMCMCLGAFRLGCDSGSSGHGVAFVPYSAAEGAEMRRWAG